MTSKRPSLDGETLRDWFERSLTDCADFYEHKPHAFLWSARRCAEALCAILAARGNQPCDRIDEQSLDALTRHVPKRHQGSVRNIQLAGNYGAHVQPTERFELRVLHTKSEEVRGSLIVLTEWLYDEALQTPRSDRVVRDLARLRSAGAATISTPPLAPTLPPQPSGWRRALPLALGALIGGAIVHLLTASRSAVRPTEPPRHAIVTAPAPPPAPAEPAPPRDAGVTPPPPPPPTPTTPPPIPAGMVLIPAGLVVIGQPSRATDAWGTPRHPNATPRATVTAFALDRNAVTVRDYEATAARDPSLTIDRTQCQRSAPGPDEPVVCVTWWQADTFCRARGGRLPTLAEWERAADVPSSGFSITRPDFEWVDDRSPAAVLDRGPARPCPDETNTEHPRCHHTRKNRLNGPAHPRFYWNIHHAERRIHLLGFRCVIPLPDAPR